MSDDPTKTLEAWRLAWSADDLAWRTGWIAMRDDARQERERTKAERKLRDRLTFGTELWGIPKAKRKATANTDRLAAFGLPVLETEASLAQWLQIDLHRLRWFTHNRLVDSAWHYVRTEIPKRRGGKRVLLAPKTELKTIQRKLLGDLLGKLPVHPAAHGFVPGRSIVTNAAPHAGRRFVLNLDLKDFFPSISYRRVRGLFIGLGYGWSVACALALLCTERDREMLMRSGKPIWIGAGERALVQGAPTSPALSNLIARRLDARLTGLARRCGLTYTRYADDLTFSGDDLHAILAARRWASHIVVTEGFAINAEKTHLYRQSNRQLVTGLVVNDRANVPRDVRRRVRAILHNAQTTGLAAQNRHNIPNFRAYLFGLIGYINETAPEQADELRKLLNAVKD